MISASYETMMDQAPKLAGDFLRQAIDRIDEQLGEGYAAANPVLLGAFLQASVSEFNSSALITAIQEAYESISSALGD